MLFRRAVFGFLSSFIFAVPLFAQGFDHSSLDSFLKRHVDERGRINYAAAAQDRADLDEYLLKIETADLRAIQAAPKPENTAFWLNVYHAGLLAAIFENYPIASTKDVPSFWERQFLKVGLEFPESKVRYSLSGIRSNIGGDGKTHLAAATASASGPLFPREAFVGPKVTGQIFRRVRAELNRLEMMTIDVDAKRVILTQLFQWYAPDFMEAYNRPERRAKLSSPDTAVVNFLIRYVRDIDQQRFLKSGQFKVEYFPYDWSLNDRTV